MSSNKHALIRYRIIDRCLRNVDNQWNWKSLSDACVEEFGKNSIEITSISERTIKEDIRNMRSNPLLGYYAPIEYDRSEKSYYYTNRSYAITETPLNRSDSRDLRDALDLIRQNTGFAHLKGIENIIQKLELLVYESTEKKSNQAVHLEQRQTTPGLEHLDLLYKVIRENRSLNMTYMPFGKKGEGVIVSPYLLKEYDQRWYMVGQNHKKKAIRTYGLERIKSLEFSLATYRDDPSFDAEGYFDDVVGITVAPDSRKRNVKFRVEKGFEEYIITRPIHHSQMVVKKSNVGYTFQLKIIPNHELEQSLLSYGELITILSPSWFRKKIENRLITAISKYS